MKKCRTCGIEKPLDDFRKYKLRSGSSSYRGDCKSCLYTLSQNWRKANPEKVKAMKLRDRVKHQESYTRWKSAYYRRNLDKCRKRAKDFKLTTHGWNPDEIETIYNQQEGKCAICGIFKPLGGRLGMCCDHDHTTGKRRDMLCPRCNHLLGHALDNPEICDKAAAYLRRHANGRS